MSEPADKEGSNSFTPIYEADPPLETGRPPTEILPYVQQLKETADKLLRDGANRGDVKLLSTALRELRYAFKVFSAYKHRRKVTVFGSARTHADHPAYLAAVEFGRRIADAGYMVITGAASGIMEAGHRGAGRENSIGVNIMLPFEQSANPIIAGDLKLMHLKYFFTRKLLFVKESDAIVLFPGGFGTHDEGWEVLTLIQTGKSHMFPVVFLDQPGGSYWKAWQQFVESVLLPEGYISPPDLSLYKVTDSIDEAVEEVQTFYRVYHSMRYVKNDLVFRLQRPLSEATLERVRSEFGDIIKGGTFEQTGPLAVEGNEPQLTHLTRLRFRFDRHGHGRLRQLIDLINRS
jgi:uncharacterized protein (TIGR00730 family)